VNTSEQSDLSRPPITAWQAESLRLTLFPARTAQTAEQTWWNDLFGEPPEVRNSRLKIGEQREEGPFEEGKLILAVQPGRVDWRFTVAEKGVNVGEVRKIGPFLGSLDKFSKLMLDWFELGTCPATRRLAFGAVLVIPAKDRQEGYRQISAYLPYDLDPEGSSDFLYQINRPRDSKTGIAGLRIHRLSKWSVATIYWMESELFFGLASALHFQGPQVFACRLELDINTVPDLKNELVQEQLPEVFRELLELGKEIAREGDVP
jgi:hypothetical protein